MVTGCRGGRLFLQRQAAAANRWKLQLGVPALLTGFHLFRGRGVGHPTDQFLG